MPNSNLLRHPALAASQRKTNETAFGLCVPIGAAPRKDRGHVLLHSAGSSSSSQGGGLNLAQSGDPERNSPSLFIKRLEASRRCLNQRWSLIRLIDHRVLKTPCSNQYLGLPIWFIQAFASVDAQLYGPMQKCYGFNLLLIGYSIIILLLGDVTLIDKTNCR